MGKFTKIPLDTFNALQLDAGVLLNTFNPANPVAPSSSDIICPTTGGISISCTPTFSDLGEDVDNCPVNMKELAHLDNWACSISFTSLGTSLPLIKLALGAADIDGTTSKVSPRRTLSQSDFSDIWWVGDRADSGCVAVKLLNALSTSGLSLQTTKNGKGQVACTITGYVSINAQDTMPMEFYSIDPATASCSVTQTLTNVTSSFTDDSVDEGDSFAATLTADMGYEISSVSVKMGGVDVTTSSYNATTNKISIAAVTGNIIVTATATAE